MDHKPVTTNALTTAGAAAPAPARPEGPGLLDGLNEAQRAAVTSRSNPLCIIAGAGSGKTRVLTRRIAWRIAEDGVLARHTLAITFARRAAAGLSGRLGALGIRDGISCGTFHSIAYAQLHRYWADAGRRPPRLLESKVPLLAPLVPDPGRPTGGTGGTGGGARGTPGREAPGRAPGAAARRSRVADVAAEIEWARARLVTPGSYEQAASEAGRRPPLPAAQIASVYGAYEAAKDKQNAMDFDDLLSTCWSLGQEDQAFAAALRWRFRHFYVDEYQDVNQLQQRLLQSWLAGRDDLCVVGDPNQAIYGWNGADPTLLQRMASTLPAAQVIRLDDNYRSSPEVLAVANGLIAVDSGRAMAAHRPPGPTPVISSYEDDLAEARGIARKARMAQASGRPWGSIAVLTRTNAQHAVLEKALAEAGVPFKVKGGGFLERPEVAEMLRHLSRTCRGPASSMVRLITERAEELPEELAESLAALAQMAVEYGRLDEGGNGGGFAGWLRATMRNDAAGIPGSGIDIATFHRAKGLEWTTVFLAGLEQGLVPIAQASSEAEGAEELRLLYVAITRAKLELHCSHARRRSVGGVPRRRQPSAYLPLVQAAIDAASGHREPSEARARIRAAKASLDATMRKTRLDQTPPSRRLEAGADPALLQELKRWRSKVAASSGLPAFVVFHDSTLATVASTRPSTQDQLASLPGIGPVKIARYGEELLAVVAGGPGA
ncbi:MAG: ATP-dependent DNA helicase UvrD2 [Acidimicrobiales bacterium]